MTALRVLSPLFAIALATACTPVSQIRTAVPSEAAANSRILEDPQFARLRECAHGHPSQGERRESIEDYDGYSIGYVEFDDQGWFYDKTGKQLQALLTRLNSELSSSRYKDTDFVVLTFIHGWHHNAHDNDCNVNEFRFMVKHMSEKLAANDSKRRKRIIGIYVGWRGEAIAVPGLNLLTIIDRRYTAEHVAKGSVRELFAQLRRIELMQRNAVSHEKLRTIVVGHSFGALIAFHALSGGLLADLTLKKPLSNNNPQIPGKCIAGEGPPPYPDWLILINPAFEASRYEVMHRAALPDAGCDYPEANEWSRPRMLVFSAENDWATGSAFSILRRLGTFLEAYNEDSPLDRANEKEANYHSIGFVPRYRTHVACLENDKVVLGRVPGEQASERPPFWVVRASKHVIWGHDGFLFTPGQLKPQPAPGQAEPKPHLLDFLIELYLNPTALPMSARCL